MSEKDISELTDYVREMTRSKRLLFHRHQRLLSLQDISICFQTIFLRHMASNLPFLLFPCLVLRVVILTERFHSLLRYKKRKEKKKQERQLNKKQDGVKK